MAWFFSRRTTQQKQTGRPYPEIQRSPGLALLLEIRGRQRLRSVLDLGPSSNETLQFFSTRADGVVVQDAFHSSATAGRRSEVFRFASAEEVSLPPSPARGGQRYEVVLVWDLLHYLRPKERPAFLRRLEPLLETGALVLVTAASVAPIPPVPIHFKIRGPGQLQYVFDDEDLVRNQGITTREVESLMGLFEPVRFFQLRNGYQEFLFVWRHEVPEEEYFEAQPEDQEAGEQGAEEPASGEPAPGDPAAGEPAAEAQLGEARPREAQRAAEREGGTAARPTSSAAEVREDPGPGTFSETPLEETETPREELPDSYKELSDSGRHLIVFADESAATAPEDTVDSAGSDSAGSDSAASDSAASDSAASDPAATDSVATDSVATDSVATEPATASEPEADSSEPSTGEAGSELAYGSAEPSLEPGGAAAGEAQDPKKGPEKGPGGRPGAARSKRSKKQKRRRRRRKRR